LILTGGASAGLLHHIGIPPVWQAGTVMPFYLCFLSAGRTFQVWQRKMQKKTTLAAKKPERGPKNAAKVE